MLKDNSNLLNPAYACAIKNLGEQEVEQDGVGGNRVLGQVGQVRMANELRRRLQYTCRHPGIFIYL